MNTFRTIVLILASISFIVVIGGAMYEHLGIVPVWASAAPASLQMFQGEYTITPFKFWIPIHPITLGLLVLALLFNWKTERRGSILTTVIGYSLVLAATFFWFVPELMAIIETAYNASIDPELTQRARSWEFWSQVRLASMLVMAFILLYGLSKPSETLRRRY
jgi:hypothetical protein